jgi:hypothetical protein
MTAFVESVVEEAANLGRLSSLLRPSKLLCPSAT